MFLGERRQLVEDLILADTDEQRGGPRSTRSSRCSAATSSEILEAMDGLPVTIRLIDPPLHEFLPDFTELSVKVALEGDNASAQDLRLLEAVRRLHEQNPMLGLRGVRLGLVIPGLFDMQVRAIARATADAHAGRRRPAPGDHDPAGRHRAGAGDQQGARPRGSSQRSRRRPECTWRPRSAR